MPSFESPALYIDFSRLPPPQVIEEIDYEDILKTYQQQVISVNPDLTAAVNLEQSPTNVILEAESYGEMILRERINAAARASMLPFAVGSDLDIIGARFNVQRLSEVVNGVTVTEKDGPFRSRIQISIETFSTGGSAGSYIFHAKSTSVQVRDVSAVALDPGSGKIVVTIMADGDTPVPSNDLINRVYDKLSSTNIKPLTDILAVLPVKRVDTDIVANLTLYPGPDASLVVADINTAMTNLRNRIAAIGRDLNRSSIMAALNQTGVQNVDLVSPQADIAVGYDSVVWVNSAKINIATARQN